MNECAKCGDVIKSGGFARDDGSMLCDECFDACPIVQLQFDGEDGNSFAILAACQRAARKAGWSKAAVDAWLEEATSGDREHLLDTVFEYFEVMQVKTYADTVDRTSVR